MLIFQLRHLPDLGIQTYTGRYGGEVRGKVLERQQAFLHLIHDLGMHNAADSDAGNGTAVSLRFVDQVMTRPTLLLRGFGVPQPKPV